MFKSLDELFGPAPSASTSTTSKTSSTASASSAATARTPDAVWAPSSKSSSSSSKSSSSLSTSAQLALPSTSPMPRRFVALDFETANRDPASVCALGFVWVKDGVVVESFGQLIRPERRVLGDGRYPPFENSWVHGITAAQVARAPDFFSAWAEIEARVVDADFVAAHNARFEKGVIEAVFASRDEVPPRLRYLCTMTLAKSAFPIDSAKLSVVAEHLGVNLHHHDAKSDAGVAAEIVLRAARAGHPLKPALL